MVLKLIYYLRLGDEAAVRRLGDRLGDALILYEGGNLMVGPPR